MFYNLKARGIFNIVKSFQILSSGFLQLHLNVHRKKAQATFYAIEHTIYRKTCLKLPLNRQNKGFIDKW